MTGTLALVVAACGMPADEPAAGAREEVARNVILILGDGVGQAQRDVLRLALAGPTGQLAMDRLDTTGSVAPVDGVTDSAAAATTLASGMPTAGGAIGVDNDGAPLTSVLEIARNAGKSTGLVTTAELTDATPAAFAAHVTPAPDPVPPDVETGAAEDRSPEQAVPHTIARQYLEDTGVDVLLGGGARHWDGIAEDADALGYTRVRDSRELVSVAGTDRLLGLFGDGPMFEPGGPGAGRYAPPVPLPEMTRAALTALDRREAGFFLVVDEQGVDAMAREGNGALVVEAGRALDGAVQAALDFQAVTPGTLIVVAGDHETGGMEFTLADEGEGPTDADGPYPAADSDQEIWLRWRTDGPTGAPAPVTAGGPGAEGFEGNMLNTEIFPALLEAMSLRA